MLNKKISFAVVTLLLLAMIFGGIAQAQIGNYTYQGAYTTPEMSTAPDGNNGRGIAVNNRVGSPYYGYIYYCNRELIASASAKEAVQVIQPTGTGVVKATLTLPTNTLPHDCCVDPVNDKVYVASLKDWKVYVMEPDGSGTMKEVLNCSNPGDTGTAFLNYRGPRSIFVTGSGTNRTMYIAATSEGQIWTSSDSGATWTKSKTLFSTKTNAMWGVTVDNAGNTYFVDRGANPGKAIVKFDSKGNYIPMEWEAPREAIDGDNVYTFEDVTYVNNSLGEFLLVSGTAGPNGDGTLRVYRYRMDGSLADIFGYNASINDQEPVGKLKSSNGNGLAYMSVQGNYVFINAALSSDNKPSIIKVQMPALPAGSRIARIGVDGINNITKNSITDDKNPKLSRTATPVIVTCREYGHWAQAGWDDLTYDTWIMNADGSGAYDLGIRTGSMWDPSISPDGKKTIYSTGNLWLQEGTSEPVALLDVDNFGSGGHSDWNPVKGSDPSTAEIVFTRNIGGSGFWMICKMHPVPETSEGAYEQLTFLNDYANCWWPTWSPDGTKIAFLGDDKVTNASNICVMNADGSNIKQLTYARNYGLTAGGAWKAVGRPAWSADGKYIYFAANWSSDDKDHIWVINAADGSGARMVTGSDMLEYEVTSTSSPMIAYTINDPTRQGAVPINNDIGVTHFVTSATAGSITGKVVGKGGAPVAGASVGVDGASTVTDANGAFTLSNLPSGAYTIGVTNPGYLRSIKSTVIPSGGSSAVTFVLDPIQDAADKAYIPKGISAIIKDSVAKKVSVAWNRNGSDGYNVYASSSETGPWTKVNSSVLPGTACEYTFTATTDLLSTYVIVTAVSNATETGYSYVAQAANNLVMNGSFEKDLEGWSPFWGANPGTIDTSSYIDGVKSVSFPSGGKARLDGAYEIPITPGDTYILSFAGKGTADDPSEMGYAFGTTSWWPDLHWASTVYTESTSTTDLNWNYYSMATGPMVMMEMIQFLATDLYGGVGSYLDDTRVARYRIAGGGPMYGRVKWTDGSDAAGVSMEIENTDISVVTNSMGYFYIRNVPNGQMTVNIHVPGMTGQKFNILNAGGYAFPTVTVEKPAEGSIGNVTGVVRFSDGRPAAGAVVLSHSRIDDVLGKAVADSNGNYAINGIPWGEVWISASVVGYQPTHGDANIVAVPVNGTLVHDITIDSSDANKVKVLNIYKAKTAPVIDGTINTSEWADAEVVEPFYKVDGTTNATINAAKARMLWDDENLYIAVEVNEKDGNVIVDPNNNIVDSTTWVDDEIEVFLDPMHRHHGAWDDEGIYQMTANAIEGFPGTFDVYEGGYYGWGNAADWLSDREIKVKLDLTNKKWYVEQKIPFANLVMDPIFPIISPKIGDVMGILIGRHRPTSHATADEEWSSTAVTTGNWITAYNYNDAIFRGNYVAPQTFNSPTGFVKPARWNCVSVPVDAVNMDPKSVFTGVDVANASFQYWKNYGNGDWQSYGVVAGWTGPIERGVPYWFLETNAKTEKTLSVSGYNATSDFIVTIPAHANAPYWIMVGTPFPANIQASSVQFKNVVKRGDVWLGWKDANGTAANRIIESKAQGWEPASSSFFDVSITDWNPTKIIFEPWYGYWMLVSDPNQLQIKFPVPTVK